MSSCAHAIEVEDWELGHATARRGNWLRAHFESCEPCREELAMFRAERAVFAARARIVVAPELERATVPSAERRRRRASNLLAHLPRAHLLVAACAVFAIGFSQLPHLTLTATASGAGDEPATTRVAIAADVIDTPMTRRRGAVASFVTEEPLASVASVTDDLTGLVQDSADSVLTCEPVVTCAPVGP